MTLRSGEAQGKICPFMTGIGSASTNSTPQYTTTPAIGYPPPNVTPVTHYVNCHGDGCMAWVGTYSEGRCGLVRVTDAEAMAIRLKGG